MTISAATPGAEQTVQSAAAAHNVPGWILDGVWSIETTRGANVATSSAGAEGEFQFEPATAASFGYPLTNTPTAAQFATQADDAAKYLAQLYTEHGSWEAALRAYSGGGYGLSDVQSAAKGAPAASGQSFTPTASGASTGSTGASSGLLGVLGSAPALAGAAVLAGGLLLLTVALWAGRLG